MRTWRVMGIGVLVACLHAAPAKAEAKQKPAGETQLTLPGKVYFRAGSDELTDASTKALEYVARYLAERKKVTTLRIEVHSDARGSAAYNLEMSKKRALSVARWLVAEGVACERLLPVGFGEGKPLVQPERTAKDRERNRRVDFFVARRKGTKSTLPADGGGHIAGDPCASK